MNSWTGTLERSSTPRLQPHLHRSRLHRQDALDLRRTVLVQLHRAAMLSRHEELHPSPTKTQTQPRPRAGCLVRVALPRCRGARGFLLSRHARPQWQVAGLSQAHRACDARTHADARAVPAPCGSALKVRTPTRANAKTNVIALLTLFICSAPRRARFADPRMIHGPGAFGRISEHCRAIRFRSTRGVGPPLRPKSTQLRGVGEVR